MTSAASHFTVGQKNTFTKVINESDVTTFAAISGDHQPLHTDPAYGSQTRFGGQIAHGILQLGLVSAVLGNEMAGPDYTMVFLGCNVNFTKPVFLGDEITAACELTDIRSDKPILTLSCSCSNQHGEETLRGEAVVYVDPFPAEEH